MPDDSEPPFFCFCLSLLESEKDRGDISVHRGRRRKQKEENVPHRKDMMDDLLEVEDENGRQLNDEEIIDILLMYLGHESSGHITMWATIFMQEHPKVLETARAEQKEILRRRPRSQGGMTLKEFRQMDYLSKVIDETLRLIAFSLVVFREAKTDCPGNDLAKLEKAKFLHHFFLNYRLERVNPRCPVRYLPHSRPKDNCLTRIRKI